MNLILKSWIKYFDTFFNPRNVISFLILLAPFTLGKFPVLSFNYILYTYVCIFVLVVQVFMDLPGHLKLINNKILVLIVLFVLSFFLSMVFGLDYRIIGDLTDFDSSFSGVLLDLLIFIPMQVLLVLLIFTSVNSIEDVEHFIKMFFVSGFIVNTISLFYVLSNFTGRLGATFTDSNYLGRFEIFIISLSLIIILYKSKNLTSKVLLVINMIISFIFMYLSYSRSAILTLGILVALIFVFNGKSKLKYILVISSFALIAILFSFVTAARVEESSVGGNNVLYNIFLEPSNFTRIILNIAGFNMFVDYPIFGVGYHNFYNAYINYSYIPLNITLFFSRNNSVIHSWLFSVFAEQGLMGAVPLIIIIFIIFRKLHKLIKMSKYSAFRFSSISLYSLFFVLIFNGLFFPVFYSELVFSLIIGVILGFFKVVDLKR